jgi:hypothetical protein
MPFSRGGKKAYVSYGAVASLKAPAGVFASSAFSQQNAGE